jgi:hypothetical protein
VPFQITPEEITTLLLALKDLHSTHGGSDESLTTCTEQSCADIREGIMWLSQRLLRKSTRSGYQIN